MGNRAEVASHHVRQAGGLDIVGAGPCACPVFCSPPLRGGDEGEGDAFVVANDPTADQFRKRVLNLDSSVTEEILKLYIAYKSATNFVDVVPQKSRLRLSINMRFSEIDDPKGLCKDVTNLGRWGNGDME